MIPYSYAKDKIEPSLTILQYCIPYDCTEINFLVRNLFSIYYLAHSYFSLYLINTLVHFIPILSGSLTTTLWFSDHYSLVLWPILSGSLTTTLWFSDHYSLVLWPLLSGSLTTTLWFSDHYSLVLWPLLSGSLTTTLWYISSIHWYIS
jgi:hypothetical protein